MLEHAIKYPAYEEKCAKLLKRDDVRFAGIIDWRGVLVAGGFKDGLRPLETDELRIEEFMEFVYGISQREDYDYSLGPINYLASRRDRVVLMSFPFPLTKLTLLISAEPTVNIERMAELVVHEFDTEQARLTDR